MACVDRLIRWASLGMVAAGLFGCELIATVNRDQIPAEPAVTEDGGTDASLDAGGLVDAADAAGDGAATCNVPTDCPVPSNECVTRTCVAGGCGTTNVAAGTKTSSQKAGDCKANQCDGNGQVVQVNDDTDVLDDNNECTDNVCTSGTPSNPNKVKNSACGTGLQCDGNGKCVGCTATSQCPGQDNECETRTCTNGTCGFDFTTSGTKLTAGAQVVGDCKVKQCGANGLIVDVIDDTDKPVDGKQCTDDVCASGTASNPPVPARTACAESGGTTCNATGECVPCSAPSECPGTDNDCQTRTCKSGACGMSYQGPGTVAATQTAGDCKVNKCDGAGNVESLVDDTDKPVDGMQCTDDVCTGGTPSNPSVALRTACTQSGGTMCNASGQCVACIAPSDCSGTDNDCQTRTCTGGACGMSYQDPGTVAATQTAGDCKVNKCDGAGNVESLVDDTDKPVDGKECTDDVCTNGTPSNPNSAPTTPCTEGGGTHCDGNGLCVP